MRRQLTIWIVKGEIAVLVLARETLVWALAKIRARGVVRRAQRDYLIDQKKAAREAHPSSQPFIPTKPLWTEMEFSPETDSDSQPWEQNFPFDFEIMDEEKWAWDEEQRAWYLKDSRETDPDDDR